MATNSAGIRITQAGVSALFAADYQFVFNSDWPSLAIAFDTTITVAAGGIGQVAHNLGFYPLTMAWYSVNGVSMGRFYGITTFDKEFVYINNSSGGFPNTSDVTVNIKCYNVDISKPVNYYLPKAPVVKTAYDPTTGIKVSKFGKSISSTDLRDFILHSRAQSPALLVIKTEKQSTIQGGTTSVKYTNPANYTPWVLAFLSPLGNPNVYQCFPPGGNQSTPAFFIQGTTSIIWVSDMGSLVVLRDPLVIPTYQRVIY